MTTAIHAGGLAYGPHDSPSASPTTGARGTPPLYADLILEGRRGCDVEPIDPTSDAGRLALLSYIWLDHRTRFDLLKGALDIARDLSVAVGRGRSR